MKYTPEEPVIHPRTLVDPVVITGMGITSCLGLDVDAVFAAVLAGHSAHHDVENLSGLGLRCCHAATVDRQNLHARSPKQEHSLAWPTQMALHAARSALIDAGTPGPLGDTPLFIGCSIGAPSTLGNTSEELNHTHLSSVDVPTNYAHASVVGDAATILEPPRRCYV
ncbi:MAG: beta-ketoacyl synthase N-terminal-like domain-containing protein [Myxococcota bacterium]